MSSVGLVPAAEREQWIDRVGREDDTDGAFHAEFAGAGHAFLGERQRLLEPAEMEPQVG